jgi:hypothetical protein
MEKQLIHFFGEVSKSIGGGGVPKNQGAGLQTWHNSPSPQPNQAGSPPPFYSY